MQMNAVVNCIYSMFVCDLIYIEIRGYTYGIYAVTIHKLIVFFPPTTKCTFMFAAYVNLAPLFRGNWSTRCCGNTRTRRKGCHRCLVMYQKHPNVLQYKESECDGDNMYMDQSNPAAMAVQHQQQPLRSILNSDHRGSAHPNTNGGSNNNNNHGHSRQSSSSSDAYQAMRSHDEMMANDCKHFSSIPFPIQKPLFYSFTYFLEFYYSVSFQSHIHNSRTKTTT